MAEVNSHRESGASERDFEPPASAQGAQLSGKNGRIPGLQRRDRRAERVSPEGVLAEGAGFELLVPSFAWAAQSRCFAVWCSSGVRLWEYRHRSPDLPVDPRFEEVCATTDGRKSRSPKSQALLCKVTCFLTCFGEAKERWWAPRWHLR